MKHERIITQALLKLLREPYPGDPKHRTGAELLAVAVFKTAVEGSTSAATLIADRIEGKAVERVEVSEPQEGNVRERIARLVQRLRAPETVQ